MKKTICAFLACCLLLLAAACGGPANETGGATSSNPGSNPGNTETSGTELGENAPQEEVSSEIIPVSPNNIHNGGFVTADNGWIYYRGGSADSYTLNRMRSDGSGAEKIMSENCWYLNVVDGWMYFARGRYNGMWKARTDGTEMAQLTTEAVVYITVKDGWIYYADQYGIKRMTTDGTDETLLAERGSYPIICGEWIFYDQYPEGSWQSVFSKMRLDGSEKTELSDRYSAMYALTFDGYVYCGGEMKFPADGGDAVPVTSEAVVQDGWIYRQYDDGALFLLEPDDDKRSIKASNPNFAGEWCFFYNSSSKKMYQTEVGTSEWDLINLQ